MDRMPSTALRVIADQESLQLFFAIATKNGIGSKDLRRLGNLTKKEYYSRTSQMLETGLIKRTKGVFRLTAFGQVMYQACLQIDEAVQHFSELKIIDVIDENAAIEDDERQKLVTLLMDNDTNRVSIKK
jgi:predicted transcriptional regulator